jgi:N-acetylglucosamine kinase-like BadF-type ATPase
MERTQRRFSIAVDIGGSHTSIRIEDENQAVAWQTQSHPSVRTAGGGPDLARVIEMLNDAFAAVRAAPAEVDSCAIGAASLLSIGGDRADLLEWARSVAIRRLAVTGDTITSYLGALGDRSGAVLACGTGVIGVGRSSADAWRRVDGWGYLLGDIGGGGWIGTLGLRAALRALDGRPHGSTGLLRALSAQFGSVRELISALYSDPNPAGTLAGFAQTVIEAAAAEDPIAREIRDEAIDHLADSAVAVLPDDADDLSYLGGLFKAVGFADLFERAVRSKRPQVVFVQPHGDALDGAMMLAHRIARSSAALHYPGVTTYDRHADYAEVVADCDWQFAYR